MEAELNLCVLRETPLARSPVGTITSKAKQESEKEQRRERLEEGKRERKRKTARAIIYAHKCNGTTRQSPMSFGFHARPPSLLYYVSLCQYYYYYILNKLYIYTLSLSKTSLFIHFSIIIIIDLSTIPLGLLFS